MTKPKRQHWVPRFYLKGFATPQTKDSDHPQVWVFSKRQGDKDAFRTSIENVASEFFLYSPLGENGERDFSVEEKLSELEGFLSQKWKEISTGFVSLVSESPFRKILALFIATMIVRHPDQIEEIRRINKRLVRIIDAAPRDASGLPQISIPNKMGDPVPVDFTDWRTMDPLSDTTIRRLFSENIHPAAGDLAGVLMQKRWAVIFADEPSFCTSDRPVVMCHPTAKSFGVGTKGTTILFPLSPTRLLMLDDRTDSTDGGYYPIQEGAIGTLGFTVWFYTHRFLISHVDSHFFLREIAHAGETEKRRLDAMWPLRTSQPGRNQPCLCGSGRKWKYCCGAA